MPDNNAKVSSSESKSPTASSSSMGKKNNTPTENSYSAKRNNQNDNNQNQSNKKSQEQDANKKTAKVAAKGAATYFGGGAGGAAVDKLANTKAGNAVLDKAGKAIGKIPGASKLTKKLNDSGTLDKADKGLSMAGGASGGSAAGASKGATAGAGNNESMGGSSKGLSSPQKGGGLGKKSPFGNDELSDDNQSDESDSKKGKSSGNIAGSMFLPDKKKIIIGICVALFPFILFFCIFSAIGSADEEEAETNHGDSNYMGNPDKKESKGSKYETKWSTSGSMVSIGGSCTYDIKGTTNGRGYTAFNQQVSDIKVRLMHSSFCDGTDNVPIEGEELVDFETYILGVVYAEIGGGSNETQAKTQAVAARSFVLDRAIRGGNKANGVKLENENGQWVLQIRNCVADQVFCNPDKGCSKRGAPSNQLLDVYSGENNPQTYKGVMDTNAKSRQWIGETAGQVLVDNKGYIVGTSYASTLQNNWASQGLSLDYKQVLLESYGANKDIYTASCAGGTISTGDYTLWKQYGAPWSPINLGNSSATIQTAGCLATSVSMLIAKSKVTTIVSGTFDPGTFVQALSANGGFDNNGNLQWNAVSRVAPNFIYQNSQNIKNYSKQQKLGAINNLLNQGYYVVAEVKGDTGQHWVAIDSVNGNNINMFDPGSSSSNMWSEYNWKNTSRIVYFKAN